MKRLHLVASVACLLPLSLTSPPSDASELQFGFARQDIAPQEPQRLSGYGSRTESYEGVDESLWTRCMALKTPAGRLHALVTVDTIGLPGSLVGSISETVDREYGIDRSCFVVCFTHAHTAPHIDGGLTNIFSKPLTQQEQDRAAVYTRYLASQVVRCVGEAIKDLALGTLRYGQGQVRFAQNRRVLQEGKWIGFGVNENGPVDHALPILQVTGTDGSTRGILFNYACHCTTFGGEHNRVHGDWAGCATRCIEEAFPGSCALGMIGCGADANPPRDPARAAEIVLAAGQEIRDEVQRVTAEPLLTISGSLQTAFGYADLPFAAASLEALQARLDNANPQTRRHAQNMLAIQQRTGKLPESYAAPVQAWRFGDQLTMVFLSGEVVVDYALRLKRELNPGPTWVTAYANDLFAYVASERVRREGGYEVDQSMIYYNQLGPWAEGTEEVLVRRIHEIVRQAAGAAIPVPAAQ